MAGQAKRKKQIADGESVTDLRQQVLRLQGQLDERTAELRERTVALNDAIEQQSAATEVLQVINSSPGDLTPVFDAMLEKGVQLCEASFGLLMTYDGECFHTVALHGVPEAYAAFLREPIRPAPQNGLGRLLSDERLIHIADITADDAYRLGDPLRVATADLGGSRTHLVVPLLKDSSVLGVIVAYRQEVRPFTEKQIALLQNFAAQAVIAMENARLITETREALEQQTATAAILRVISNSPTDVQPTFDAIVASAATLCEAEFSAVARFDDGLLHLVATNNLSSEEAAAFYSLFPRPPQPNFVLGRAFLEGRPAQFEDVLADADYDARIRQVLQSKLRYRTFMAVPILRAGVPIGVVGCGRRQVQPFTTNQIDLLNTFAEQAAIALDNVRLFNELSARNRDLTEALEYQTATSDVLKIVSQSGANIEPVLQTVVEMAARLCEADKAVIGHLSDGLYRTGASVGFSEEYKDYRSRSPIPLDRGTAIGRMILDRRAVHIEDAAADPDYTDSVARDLGQFRTVLSVPMKREEAVVGGIFLARSRVEPFTDKQIALVATFADQAAIAIENARLITETREALEQQTATAEVLGVINASPGDLAPVFDAMLEKAMRLCGALFGELRTYDGERFLLEATHGTPAAYIEYYRRHDTGRYAAGTGPARLLAGERVVHIPDLIATEPYQRGDPDRRAIVDIAGARAYVLVPLLLNEAVRGFILIYRQEARPFTEKQIALLQNFAAQAVIAIENTRLITETKEALDQQTATAEVLQVINSSPGDLAPVFEAMLDKAMRLCEAVFGFLTTYDGQNFRPAAQKGVPEALAEYFTAGMDQPRPGDAHSRLLDGEDLIHNDQKDEDAYRSGNPLRRAVVDLGGARTALVVALRKDRILLGALTIYRQEVRPFSDKQIALLQNFAAQAVIAIENARLITETREALEQQTATSEVLQIINSSPGDLTPVFDAMLEKAARLCNARFGLLWLYEADEFRAAAVHAVPAALADFVRKPLPAEDSASMRDMVHGHSVVHVPDLADSELYRSGNPSRRAYVDLGGARTLVSVALRRDNTLLGAFNIYRQEVRPFSDKEITLVENFAAQAVIAMENARLITETREALEQQTATAEVLGVINSSPGDLEPVFQAILQKAHKLCGVAYGSLQLYEAGKFRAVAVHGLSEALADHLRQGYTPGPNLPVSPLLEGDRFAHVADLGEIDDPMARRVVELGGTRTLLWVALRKDDRLLGMIAAARLEVRPFSDKEIDLLESFAAQAVIAMENARLLNEIRQRQAELRVTFDNMGDGVVMFDEKLRLAAWNRNFQELLDLPDGLLTDRPSYSDYLRILAERGEFGTVDVEAELARRLENTDQEFRQERTRPDGRVIEVRRNAVPDGGFVLIYGDITERKRSEAEIRAARDAAEAAYRDLKAAQANLIQAEKMASLGQLTAGIAHEIKNPLNFVNNFAGLSVELLEELKETTAPAVGALGDDKRAEIDDTMDMLTSNLEKIAEHGRRADGIVRSMLEHSRGETGERRSVDLNGLVEEALNLAYHGGRAQDQSFNITLERDYGRDLAPIELVPQDITRVCLNLFGNGFYAATKRQKEGGDPTFKPTLKVMTRDLGDAVEVRARDNGIGIPPEIKDKLFQPFFTTKPTGEGTGLGLSISYDIVTQQHGGTIEVDSRVGEFTEFTVRLPRAHRATTAGTAV